MVGQGSAHPQGAGVLRVRGPCWAALGQAWCRPEEALRLQLSARASASAARSAFIYSLHVHASSSSCISKQFPALKR